MIDKYDKDVKPKMMEIIPENIPNKMKSSNNWLNWEWVWNGKKWSKPPRNGTSTNAMLSLKDALTNTKENTELGIGFSLEGNKFCGVDIDDCINENGKIKKKAKKIIKACDSYTEISPSGKGIRIIGIGSIDRAFDEDDLEIYDSGRYLTITGNIFPKRGNMK